MSFGRAVRREQLTTHSTGLIAIIRPVVFAEKIQSREKNVFDGFLKSHFVTSTVHAEECIVAASAPI